MPNQRYTYMDQLQQIPFLRQCPFNQLSSYIVSAGLTGIEKADGACGNMEALKLRPCGSAAEREDADVSGRCCSVVEKLLRNPSCLCATVLSDVAKSSGVNPEIAITIPKRCNIADRPIGYKCGGFTLP